MQQIGAHVHTDDLLAGAKERDAQVVQVFLGDPQGWKEPVVSPEVQAVVDAGLTVFVHAPYRLNVATTNNRIRIPSRKLLASYAKAAAGIGANGLIVHGGHVGDDSEIETGYANWRKVFERGSFELPILVENTAGGDHAMARSFESLARLWEAFEGFEVGFCLDTCHAHAAGEDVADVAERALAITGRIDLVHANGSRDEFGSFRDRHANFGDSLLAADAIAHAVQASGAPAVVETPTDGQADDVAYLKAHVLSN